MEETFARLQGIALETIITLALPFLLKKVFDWLNKISTDKWYDSLVKEAGLITIQLYETATKGIKKDLADGKLSADEAKARLESVSRQAKVMVAKRLAGAPGWIRSKLDPHVSDIVEGAYSVNKNRILNPFGEPPAEES